MSIMANTIVLNIADEHDERLGHICRKVIFGYLSSMLCVKSQTGIKGGDGKVVPQESKDLATAEQTELGRKVSSGQTMADTVSGTEGRLTHDQPKADEQDLWRNERMTAANILDRWFFVLFFMIFVFSILLTIAKYD